MPASKSKAAKSPGPVRGREEEEEEEGGETSGPLQGRKEKLIHKGFVCTVERNIRLWMLFYIISCRICLSIHVHQIQSVQISVITSQ